MTTKKKPSSILDKSTANRHSRPTNGIDSTLNDTNLPFTPEPAPRNLAFTAPRAQNKHEIPEVNIETSSLGLSPSMEDIKSKKNKNEQEDSQFERESRAPSSYDQRRSELSQKYRDSINSRDALHNLHTIKEAVLAQKNINIKFMVKTLGQLENELEKHK